MTIWIKIIFVMWIMNIARIIFNIYMTKKCINCGEPWIYYEKLHQNCCTNCGKNNIKKKKQIWFYLD